MTTRFSSGTYHDPALLLQRSQSVSLPAPLGIDFSTLIFVSSSPASHASLAASQDSRVNGHSSSLLSADRGGTCSKESFASAFRQIRQTSDLSMGIAKGLTRYHRWLLG